VIFPSEQDFALLLFQLFALLSLGLALGELFRQVRQPTPIFFASMGLRANFINHFDLPLVLAVLAVAVAAKFTGGFLGAYLGGRRGHEACAIGFGLIPQGAMGIILAFLALEFSLISETVFVALVSTALVTRS